MNQNNRRVSVIIPTYNCERFVGEAIESVLAQSHPVSQLIVVNDGSTDGTAAVVQSFGMKVEYFRQQHVGISTALNLGLSRARGDIICFLDADDIWTPEKIKLQLGAMNQNPELDMIFGYMEEFNESLNGEGSPKQMPGYCRGTMIIRKTSLMQVGLFEQKWAVGEFIEWYSRAVEVGLKSTLLTDILLRRRIHGENTMIREQKSNTDYARILKESLDRRRKKIIP